jgi:hypothetical protein
VLSWRVDEPRCMKATLIASHTSGNCARWRTSAAGRACTPQDRRGARRGAHVGAGAAARPDAALALVLHGELSSPPAGTRPPNRADKAAPTCTCPGPLCFPAAVAPSGVALALVRDSELGLQPCEALSHPPKASKASRQTASTSRTGPFCYPALASRACARRAPLIENATILPQPAATVYTYEA